MKFAISQPKKVWLPRNEKQTHRLNSRPQVWPSGLTLAMTLNFQGQIWNLLYLSQKWCNCHETKSKHIDWSQGLEYDHQVWPCRVRSTLKSAWILTLVLKSACIWSEPWKLHKILKKCLNYSIQSLNFFELPDQWNQSFCFLHCHSICRNVNYFVLFCWICFLLVFFQLGKTGHWLIGLRAHCQFATWLHRGFSLIGSWCLESQP